MQVPTTPEPEEPEEQDGQESLGLKNWSAALTNEAGSTVNTPQPPSSEARTLAVAPRCRAGRPPSPGEGSIPAAWYRGCWV